MKSKKRILAKRKDNKDTKKRKTTKILKRTDR